MGSALMLPVFFTLEALADELTRAVWNVIIGFPNLQRLYPGYYVAIHGVVLGHLHEASALSAREADGRVRLVFAEAGGANAFAERLAGAIIIRLDEVLRQARALDLMTRDLPGAVDGVLHAYVCAVTPDRRPAEAPADPAVSLPSPA